MAGMKKVRGIALWFGACFAAILAIWTASAVLNALFLVPSNPALTPGQNLRWKIGSTVLCAVASYLFFRLSQLAFRKARQKAK